MPPEHSRHITLTAPLAQRVEEVVASGAYASIDDFICMALRRVKDDGRSGTDEQASDDSIVPRGADLSRLWHNAQDLQVVIDPEGVFLSVSPSATRLVGWTPEEMVGRSLFEFIRAEDEGAASREALRRAVTEPMSVHRNCYRHKDGGDRWIEWRTTPEAGMIYCYGRDVSAEVEQAAALRDSEERGAEVRLNNRRMQTALAAGAIIGTWIWDIPNDRFTVDEAFATAFGLDTALGREGIPMAQIVATVHPDDQVGLAAAIGAAIERGGRYAHQYRVLRVDGRYHWLEANGHVEQAPDGTPLRFPGVLIDIAARRFDMAMNGLSERLRTLDTPQQMAMAASETAGQALNVTRVAYGDVDAAGQRIVVRPDWLAAGQSTIAGELAFLDFGSYIEDLRRGEDVVIDDVAADPRTATQVENLRGIGIRSLVNLPLMERGRLKVVFCLNDCEPHAWSADELAFARRVVDRTEVEIARRAAEDGLRQLNASLERRVEERTQERNQIWQVSRDMLMVSDLGGVWLSVNPALTRVLGWREDELVGRTSTWLRHPDDQALTELQLTRLVAGETISFENRFRTRAGDYRSMSWTAVPHEGRIYAVSRDVTDERAQAENLRRSERRAVTFFEFSNDYLLLVRVGVDGVMRCDDMNPACARVMGVTVPDVIGRPVCDFLPPDGVEAVLRHARLCLETGEPQSYLAVREYQGDRKLVIDGRVAFVERSADGGGLVLFSGTDVTEQRQTEEALRQSQKMEAVGQLTGGLAHDFNNLLTGISGSLDLLQKRVAQGRIDELNRYVVAAQGASKRAAALTHRLLAFSRRQTLDPKPTDPSKLIKGMVDLIRRTVGPGITVETVDMVGLWTALVDPNQLENALLNLAINARDAMPDGGRLTIETGNKWMDDRAARARDVPPGQYLSICVSDTGTGMPPDVVARAFDPFFTTKPLGMGTGLGLSMIYGFARQSGGMVRIYSEVGQGTMVCLYLPRHYGDEEAAVANEIDEVRGAEVGETVLVVDDEATIRMLVTDVLSDLGYRALEAEDGATGLRILRTDARVDLLVTDVGLPGGMNGRQVADAARALRPGLKVLFITGYAENAAIGNGHLDPGMAVLTKPFAMDDLAVKIRDIIG